MSLPMARTPAMAPASTRASTASRHDALLLSLPVALLMCLQAGLFIWAADRGIDFTDESYYLLNYLHWRELSATVTFFGAYFEVPFRLFGQHVAAMRIFGMVMLMAAGGFFAWRVLAFAASCGRAGRGGGIGGDDAALGRGALHPAPGVVVGMLSACFYYSYVTTLRAPSYNLLVLFCMLVATGLMLALAEGRGTRTQRCATALGYGLLLGACALGKAPSAAAMVFCHGVFFVVFNRRRGTVELAAMVIAGVALNLMWLQVLRPGWVQVLRDGVTLTTTLDGRYSSIPFANLRDAALRGAVRLLPLLALGALPFAFIVRRWGRTHRALLSGLVVALVTGIMLTIQLQGYGKSWWALLLFGTAMLAWAERACCTPAARNPAALGLSALLFALPVAYSIGTNGSLPAHTQMAAVFGVVAMMLPLQRLWVAGLIHRSALALALAVLCLPTLVSQWRSLTEPDFTYRLRTGLLGQRLPLVLGAAGDALRVDEVTRDNIAAFSHAMHAAGYVAGEPILDVTGDGPGLVYALGGRPVGTAWLIGGYAGSERVAMLVLNSVPAATLRQAWVVSADDNPRALPSWAAMLRERVGGPSHMLAGTMPYWAQYRWDGKSVEPLTLSLWRPTSTARLAVSPQTPCRRRAGVQCALRRHRQHAIPRHSQARPGRH